jgi:hypothetical protein
MATMDDFREELEAEIGRAAKQGRPHIEINAGELHRIVARTRTFIPWPAQRCASCKGLAIR